LRTLCLVLFLLAACASAPPPLASPNWDVVPGAVVDSLCLRMRDDGITHVAVVQTTQPIATPQSLGALGAASRKRSTPERAAAAMQAAQKKVAIDTNVRACTATAIPGIDARRHADVMIVELSSPLANPYAAAEAGLFARVSLGGTHPSWYWIPLGHRNGMWIVGRAMPLAM
jgi:hypothetical protein